MVSPRRDGDDTARLKGDGRIDPASLDLASKPKRKRKARNRPDPSPELKAWAPGAEKRMMARPLPPGIMLEPAGTDEEQWTSPHSDGSLWSLQLGEAFGTRSRAVIETFTNQLERLCKRDIWDEAAQQWRLDESELSAALAMVNAIKPTNEVEAAHAAQMVAVHLMTMKLAARALRYDADIRTASAAGKLARTYSQQLEQLNRLRGKNPTKRQSIKVSKELHQHVTYEHHHHYPRGGDTNDGQPHETPSTDLASQCAALPGPKEASARVVRLPSRKR